MAIEREDLNDVISPLQAMRMDIAQINSFIKGSGSFQKGLGAIFNQFDKSTTIMKSVVQRLSKNISGDRSKQLKQLGQGIEGVLMQKFTKDNVKKKYFDKFAQQFGKSFQPKILQALRKSFNKGLKSDDWKPFYTQFQNALKLGMENGIKPKSSSRAMQSVFKDFGDGLKMTLNRQFRFLPDFLRRPLTKGIGNSIDKSFGNLGKVATQSKFIRGTFQSINKFATAFALQIGIAAAIVVGMVKLFQQMQGAWARINKQFGGLILSFEEMRAQSRKFTMQTGLGMQKFKDSTIAVVKQFGFFDEQAIKTTGLLNRVFGVTFDERSKVQRIIGGPGKSIRQSLDYVTKQTIAYGRHGRQIFKDIIRLGDKFRTLTDEQRKGFIQMSAALSSIGVTGTTVFQNLEKGFGSIDTALQTTKQMNLRILQMGYNSGKTFKMFSATRSIDIYKRTRVGDTQKAFEILSQQVGPDFIKSFDSIKSEAAKRNFLQTAFGDVEQGQKIMDSMRNMLQVFGTTDVKKLKERFKDVFSGAMAQQKTTALIQKIKKMSMDSSEEVRNNAKKLFEGSRPQILAKLKVQVGTKVQTVDTFNKMAAATTTLGDSLGRLWEAFKRGFTTALLPMFQGINKAIGGTRTADLVPFFARLGQVIGTLITTLPVLIFGFKSVAFAFQKLGFIFNSMKFLNVAVKIGQAFGFIGKIIPALGIFGKILPLFRKFLGPIGMVITAIQALMDVFDTFGNVVTLFKKGQWGKAILGLIVDFATLAPRLIINRLIDLINLLPGINIPRIGKLSDKFASQASPGAATGDYVTATSGGVQRTVGQGGKDQIISPVNDMQAMADRARLKASGGSNSQLIAILKQQNQMLKTMVQKLSSPLKLTDRSGGLPRLKIQGDIAHIVSGQLRYRMK